MGFDTAKYLLEQGANPNTWDWWGRTPLYVAVDMHSFTSRFGPQVALYGAINWGWTRVVQFLLDHGARVDIADAAGKTPLDATKGNAGGRDAKVVEDVVVLIKKASAGGV